MERSTPADVLFSLWEIYFKMGYGRLLRIPNSFRKLPITAISKENAILVLLKIATVVGLLVILFIVIPLLMISNVF
jgi:hypothetical protein